MLQGAQMIMAASWFLHGIVLQFFIQQTRVIDGGCG